MHGQYNVPHACGDDPATLTMHGWILLSCLSWPMSVPAYRHGPGQFTQIVAQALKNSLLSGFLSKRKCFKFQVIEIPRVIDTIHTYRKLAYIGSLLFLSLLFLSKWYTLRYVCKKRETHAKTTTWKNEHLHLTV